MKKTLLVTTDFSPRIGGVATYWDRVCSSLDSDQLIVLTNVHNAKHNRCSVVQKELFYKKFWPKWLKGVKEIYHVYKQNKCKQIVVAQLLPVGNMVLILHILFKIPYVVQIYGMDILQATAHKRKKMLANFILKRAKHVIVNTQAVGDIIERFGVERDRYSVVYPIPHALPTVSSESIELLKSRYGIQGKKIVLTIGRLVPRKGQDMTLGAMMHVWQKVEDAVYVIVGEGEHKAALEKMASPHANKVIFTGAVSEGDRNTWLAACDVFAMPARQTSCDIEGFGIVYLEAHQYEKPVIAGNVGGCVEAVEDGVTGLLVNPEDIDEISEAIIELLTNKEKAKQLGGAGKRRLQDTFLWSTYLERFKHVL